MLSNSKHCANPSFALLHPRRTRHQGLPAADEKFLLVTAFWDTADISFDFWEALVDPMSSDII